MKPSNAAHGKRALGAAELGRAFDASFALPARAAEEELEDLLAVRVASDRYALRARELSGVAAIRRLTWLPSKSSELLGLVSVRGLLVPVFGFSLLLGYDTDPEPVRWLALVGSDEPVALAFHELTGFERVPKRAFSAAEESAHQGEFTRETVSFDEQVRVVIGVSALVASIRSRLGRERPKKEA